VGGSVAVFVAVGGTCVLVDVGNGVAVEVGCDVGVGSNVAVFVAVSGTGVLVDVGASVAVLVRVGVRVGICVGGTGVIVTVGVTVAPGVAVAPPLVLYSVTALSTGVFCASIVDKLN
jgi:hypothetical protein